jgi:hypothetical protein
LGSSEEDAMSKADEALRHNWKDVLENGPGLRYGRKTAMAAKCPTGKHVLETGLGAMGLGSMWREASSEDRSDPEWDALATRSCSNACEK